MSHWNINKGDGIRIVLIDSGTNISRKEFAKAKIKNYIFDSSAELVEDNDNNDNLGHGTANAFILHKQLPNAMIYSIKLFDKNRTTSIYELMNALRYIHQHLTVDLIHISNGVTYCECLNEFEGLCKMINEKGIIIVSSFDNNGAVSYPAAFNSVIGVDWHELCTKVNQYYFVENSIVNVMGIGSVQRLPWTGESYKRVSGSSFTAPYITGIVGKVMQSGIQKRANILLELRNSSEKVITIKNSIVAKDHSWVRHISKVILFPYNKEMHSLIRYKNELPFEVTGVFDNYGNSKQNVEQPQIGIQSINDIDWNSDFDTVILGHTGILQSINKKDYKEYFVEKCKKHFKHLYSFDPIPDLDHLSSKETPHFYYPSVKESDIPKELVGKLHKIPSPVLGIFGTSPRQGKFTLQIRIRNILKKKGYIVGQLGTEPSSLLFGTDEVYPMGYNATVEVMGSNSISVVNQMMLNIYKRVEPDIIIVGSQSQSVPYTTGNIGFYPIMQHDFLIGTEPDAIILCINPNDEISFIKRTINYLESFIETKVIGISMFPLEKVMEWKMSVEHGEAINADELHKRKTNYENTLNLPVYLLGNEQDDEKMIASIESYFS